MGSIGGTAENLARGIDGKLYHALRLVDGKGFAVGTIVALEGVAVDALLFCLIFGDAYAGSFGIGEDAEGMMSKRILSVLPTMVLTARKPMKVAACANI